MAFWPLLWPLLISLSFSPATSDPKWGIAQFVVLALITAVMLLSDPLQTVQGDPNDGWVPQIGFILAWLGTGFVLLSGRYYDPEMEV